MTIRSEEEIKQRLVALSEGWNEDKKAKRNRDAEDKAMYISALVWVLGKEPENK